jgi:DNA-directed RNA polymerase subunit RPC12/RpoP
MCGPQREFEKFMPDDVEDFEKCTHGVSLNKDCLTCDAEYGDEPICDHDTKWTGERDEEDRKITQCKHCGKEFVQIHAGKKDDDATDH